MNPAKEISDCVEEARKHNPRIDIVHVIGLYEHGIREAKAWKVFETQYDREHFAMGRVHEYLYEVTNGRYRR